MNQIEINSMINTVFGTPHGQKLIKYLTDTMINRPTYKKGMTLDEVAFREGQKDIIIQLKKELKNV